MAATKALAALPSDAAAVALTAGLSDHSRAVRLAAAWGIEEGELSRRVSRSAVDVRLAAVRTLEWLADRRAITVLIRALEDTEWDVRLIAADALKEFVPLPRWTLAPLTQVQDRHREHRDRCDPGPPAKGNPSGSQPSATRGRRPTVQLAPHESAQLLFDEIDDIRAELLRRDGWVRAPHPQAAWNRRAASVGAGGVCSTKGSVGDRADRVLTARSVV